MHAFSRRHLECVPVHPFFTCGRRVSDRRGNNLRCSLLPRSLCLVLLCTAPLCQATDNAHSLGYENEEEGETEGGNDRETEELHTLRHGQTVRFLSLYCFGRNTLPSPSQFGYRMSTQSENPDLCFISVFKFGSNICQTFFSLFLRFFFFCLTSLEK